MECLDLVAYLRGHNRVDDVKMICCVNRQVQYPPVYATMDKSEGNIPTLVDMLGVDIQGVQYLVKGRAFVVLGKGSFSTGAEKAKFLVLSGTLGILPAYKDYVALTTVFVNKYVGKPFLYATKTLYRDTLDVVSAYPDFRFFMDSIRQTSFEACYNQIGFSSTYGVASGSIPLDEISVVEPTYTSNSDKLKTGVTKNKQVLTCRSDILKKPKRLEQFSELLEFTSKRVTKQLNKLSNLAADIPMDDRIEYAYTQLRKNWRTGGTLKTGRALFKSVLVKVFSEYRDKTIQGVSILDDAIDNKHALTVWGTDNYTSTSNDDFMSLFVSNRELIYIGLIDVLLGLRGKLISAYNYAGTLDIDMYAVMSKNPYYLTLIDNRLDVSELDKLAMLYKTDRTSAEAVKFRNAAYLHHLLLDTSGFAQADTLVLRSDLLREVRPGFIISKNEYSSLQEYGSILSDMKVDTCNTYLDDSITLADFSYPKTGWGTYKVRGVLKYVRSIDGNIPEKVLGDFLEVGLGVLQDYAGEIYVADYNYAWKENYIINKVYSLQMNGDKPKLNSVSIENCIHEFEHAKSLEWNITDFKLEEKQSDAVRLLSNPVMCLTGPAGSGKTTTAEALVFALQGLLGIEEDDIMFCAPTGKAANILREIVKKPTRTIHSLFGIGLENYTLLKEKGSLKKNIKVLIVDESSMIDVELMYSMLSKIDEGTRVFFLGDREQNPPIGPGKPFANLLTFLPCVVLDVAKRASATSCITRNAQSLITKSDELFPPMLESAGDFRILGESTENVEKLVKGICNYHLGNSGGYRECDRTLTTLSVDLKPDDIQVITPINGKNWGTKNLNRDLQNVFNPRKYTYNEDNDIVYTTTEVRFEKTTYGDKTDESTYVDFRVGDRVIHLENKNSAIRLSYDGVQFMRVGNEEDVSSFGVLNGDVGKVIGFFKVNQLLFKTFDGDFDKSLEDSFSGDASTLYVAVEYSDVDTLGAPMKFVILYRSEIVLTTEALELYKTSNIRVVTGFDLDKLDLAYALTIHKVQGSQYPLIICVIFSVGWGASFLSRNMLYTGITRAQKGCYLVGDVLGSLSAVSKGRKFEQVSQRLTISDKLFELPN